MRRTLSLPVLLASLTVLAACHGDAPVAPRQEPPADGSAADVADRYIIRLVPEPEGGGAAAQARARRLEDFARTVERLGGAVQASFPSAGLALARHLTPAAAAELRAHPAVRSMAPDRIIRWIPEPRELRLYRGSRPARLEPHGEPTEAALWGLQWNMHVIRTAMAARVEQGDRSVDVSVLDTGIDPHHAELQGKVDEDLSRSVLSFSNCPGEEDEFTDLGAHGTAVAGTVTTNNLLITGAVQEANLIAVKVLDCLGVGSFGDLIVGILYAAEIGSDVINMSLGAVLPLPLDPLLQGLVDALHDALEVAVDAGSLVVAAAGNDALELSPYPGFERGFIVVPAQAHPQVVVVSATAPSNGQERDRAASYTNFGRGVITVSAPGGDLVEGGDIFDLVLAPCASTQVVLPFACGPTDLILWSGTSAAAPHVAGIGALADAVDDGRRRGARLRQILVRTADPKQPRAFHGAGRVDAFGAATR